MISSGALLACVLLSAGLASAQRTCSRRPPATTDCSTTTGECNIMFDANNLPSALSLPPPNTRTCYRTCHDQNGQCKSVPTVVREQKLAVQSADASSRVLRIFSPNYGRGSYRKSSNCRYRVQCDPGQIISYSVLDFDLEEKSTCSSGTECLDWVEINYKNLATRQRFCGSGELGQVHVDGSSELTFEFASNRRTEKRGFLFFVNCVNPATDRNAVRVGAVAPPSQPPPAAPVPSANIVGTTVNLNRCSEPPTMAQRPSPIEVPPALRPSTPARRYVVGMFGSIYYKSGCLLVRNAQGETVNTIRGVLHLEVTNRFTTTVRRYHHMSLGLTFSGYGTLEVNGENANFYQLGADPVLQPTQEESAAIIELEKTINSILGDDFFDVQDEYDTQGILDILPFRPQQILQEPVPFSWNRLLPPQAILPRRPVFGPRNIPDRATRLANEYGNACNAVLRSTACAYQALLLGTDCNTGLALN